MSIRTIRPSRYIYEGDYVGARGLGVLPGPTGISPDSPLSAAVGKDGGGRRGVDSPLPTFAPVPVNGGPGPELLTAPKPGPIGPQQPARPLQAQPPQQLPTVNPNSRMAAVVAAEGKSGPGSEIAQAKRRAWGLRLEKAKRQWGKTGHVETYKGVRILRKKKVIPGPDGERVTVPVFVTDRQLGAQIRSPQLDRTLPAASDAELPVQGKDRTLLSQVASLLPAAAADRLRHATQMIPAGVQGLGYVDGAVVESETVELLRQEIDGRGLATGVQPAPEPDGPGPAAGSTPVEALPGEVPGGIEVFGSIIPIGTAVIGALLVGGAVYWAMNRRKG